MHVIHTGNAPHYRWGRECDGWRLVDTEALSVIEETMPSGASETLHHHVRARQFFYVLAGEASMEIDQKSVVIGAGQGLEVSPGTPHRVYNWRADPLRFLVTSTPTTRGDRVEAVTESDA